MADTGAITNGTQSFAGNKTFENDVTVTGTLTTASVAQTNVAAGASGTAGSLQVYPTTAVKGKTSITAADNAGNTTTTITTAEQAGARTYTVPDAGGNTEFVMAAGNSTIAGTKTFSAQPVIPGFATLAGGAAFTGAVTTTNGVAGGTAKVVGGRSYAQVAAGAALTNSATETVLGSFTIPANTIGQGTMVKIRFQGIATATNANDTLQIKAYLGDTTLAGTALFTSAAVDVGNDNIFTGEFVLVGRAAAGAAAAVVGAGSYSDPGAVGTAVKAAYLATTNFATNAALLVEVSGKWSAADPGNSCRLDVLTVEVI
jgi:hypothetical protein